MATITWWDNISISNTVVLTITNPPGWLPALGGDYTYSLDLTHTTPYQIKFVSTGNLGDGNPSYLLFRGDGSPGEAFNHGGGTMTTAKASKAFVENELINGFVFVYPNSHEFVGPESDWDDSDGTPFTVTWPGTDPGGGPPEFLPCGTTVNPPFGTEGDLIRMQKNIEGQKIGAQMVTTAGVAFTGSVTVYVCGDAGTQAAGSVGAGACTHEGNGYHTYAPAQAETNYDLVAFTFVGSGAVPVTVQAAPVASGGGGLDAAGVRSAIGLGSANLDTQLSGIKTKTDLIPASPAASTDCLNAAGVRSAVGLGSANLDSQLAPLATGFARAVKAISLGTVDTGASATIIPTSSLTPAAGVADQFKGQVVCFANDTTTVNLRGCKTEITGSTSGGILSVNELPATPVSGDTFTIQ